MIWKLIFIIFTIGLISHVSTQATTVTTTANNAEKIVWNECQNFILQFIGAQCGFLSVPLDHSQPNGEQIQIAISRLKNNVSADKYQGVMLVNLGNPGQSALRVSYLGLSLEDNENRTYDWIGFDPRGVGASTPNVSCDPDYFKGPHPSYVPIDDTLENYWYNRSKEYAQKCAQNYPKLLKHLTTVDVAKDMDLIRIALNQDRINYYGSVYGSYIGQVYATLYPNRVRRMVLDGNIDPEKGWFAGSYDRNVDLGRNLKDWFNWLAKYDSVYKLGSTECEVIKKYKNARDELDINPLNGTIGSGDWDDIFFPVTYRRSSWVYSATMFSEWVNNNDSFRLVDSYQSLIQTSSENSFAVNSAVICADAPWPKDWKYVRKQYWRSYALAPYTAWTNNWPNAICLEWAVNATSRFIVDGKNIGDILLVGSALDAVTPIEDSYAVRQLFPKARLISIINGTESFASISDPCAIAAVAEYLKSGELMARKSGNVADRECISVSSLEPTPASRSRRAIKTNIILDIMERTQIRHF